MASDWQNVMGVVAKHALGAKAVRALTKPKRATRRRKASNTLRHSAKGIDRQAQICKNYIESLEKTNPSDGFDFNDDNDSDAEDYIDDSDSESQTGSSTTTSKRPL